jgi:hypothetical protein
MKKAFLGLFLLFAASGAEAQHIVIVVTFAWMPGMSTMPEHGFLPGKKFKFYPAIGKYDLGGKRLRLELHDERDSLKLKQVDCSPVEMTNTSEFEGPFGTHVVENYIDSLFSPAGIVLDTTSTDVLKVNLEALDARLIGFGSITAHGLCKISTEWKGNTHHYCVDITDKDPHSPISSHAFVTRKTATRVITAAAIREILEKVITDLEFDK